MTCHQQPEFFHQYAQRSNLPPLLATPLTATITVVSHLKASTRVGNSSWSSHDSLSSCSPSKPSNRPYSMLQMQRIWSLSKSKVQGLHHVISILMQRTTIPEIVPKTSHLHLPTRQWETLIFLNMESVGSTFHQSLPYAQVMSPQAQKWLKEPSGVLTIAQRASLSSPT
ncbi:hypothetical protein GOP47_0002165 [Adiantum capillus-veneris]|uniref:Uncharacterized protein n=1 Tax=Adiantum capillus-veneris TaxID=13818 RepID=A0A9D4VBJ5_ADICA|nr:hypothetical protein GOP47_0002165 [Adiantum capillus-veneris]